jgi:CPA1 family monovalent cation:H+ antiporter
VDWPLLVRNWQAILWGILAALLSRLIVIYGLFPGAKTIPHKWKHILYWGGLRGAISLALVLGLPVRLGLDASGQLLGMVFGVVLFTLLIQGTTMNWLVQRTGIIERREERDEYDRRRARVVTARAAYEHLEKIHGAGMISKHVWDIINDTVNPYTRELTEAVKEILINHPEVEAEELDSAWREYLQYQRVALSELFANRGITEDVYNDLSGRIDDLLTSETIAWDNAADIDKDLWQLRPPQTEPQVGPD